MKKKIAAVILVALLSAGAYWGYGRYGIADDSSLQASGTIEAEQVELCARLPGVLQKLSIKSGDSVKKNQLVALITRNDLIAQQQRDALGVTKAEAQLADLNSGAREQEIKDAEINLNTAQTNYELAQRDYDRIKELYRQEAVSLADYEKAETAWKQGKNLVDAAGSRLSLLKSGSRPEQIKSARAELDRSKAILKASEALLEDTKILSPIDGTVLNKNFEPGEYLQAGASVATVANLSDMWIKVYVSTDDLPKIKLGQKVTFTVSGSSAVYGGIIEEIADQGEFTPKSIQTKKERTNIVYAAKIRIDNQNGILKPGMPADVVFTRG
jgi:HlyD family secretion protein